MSLDSARDRRIPWPVQDARLTASRIVQHSSTDKVSILFGREDSGLNNDELRRCNLHCHIPTHPDYESLNLSMAVQIVCYEIRMAELEGVALEEDAHWENEFATSKDMEYFYEHWRKPWWISNFSTRQRRATVDDTIAAALQPCSPR